jgi:D-3-phosphoglycerate dehydrogenase
MEAALGRHMLYTVNHDAPGIIGGFGMIMANAGINIANFILGRTAPGEQAVALLELEEDLSDEILSRVREVADVLEATPLRFPGIG